MMRVSFVTALFTLIANVQGAAAFPIAQRAYLKASNTEMLDQFGVSVAVSGNTAVIGAPKESSDAIGVGGDQNNNNAINAGAAYVFVRDAAGKWTQQGYLKASNTEAFDNFGWSVAISGDTIVVGAPQEDSKATGVGGDQSDNTAQTAGAAYVFARNGTTWSQQAYLKASNTNQFDDFGISVAVSGDTIVIGADGESSNAKGVDGDESNNGALNSGAAYVFVRNGTTWSQQAYLKASNTEPNDVFGSSVAISGETVAVGAEGESSDATGVGGNETNNNAPQSGAAYVFVRNGIAWSQQGYLKASNTGAHDLFGVSVAVSGETVVVGANNEGSDATGVGGVQNNNNAPQSGAAYVFFRNGITWSQQAYLKASNTNLGDQFGISVAVSGNLVVVGAYFEASNSTGIGGNENDNSFLDSGAAYAFMRNGTTWNQFAYLKASNTNAFDNFGYSVAASEDTLLIGAYSESSSATGVDGNQSDNNSMQSGAAYVFAIDTDGDGVQDALDGCPDDPAKTAPGQCGCGVPDIDSDGDGTADCVDGCPDDANRTAPGTCGCGVADINCGSGGLQSIPCGVCGAGTAAMMPLALLGLGAVRRMSRAFRNRGRSRQDLPLNVHGVR